MTLSTLLRTAALGAALALGFANAAPVNYTIAFDLVSGPTPPESAGFAYDDATATFTNFLVSYRGWILDFTNVANNFVPGDPCEGSAGGAGAFALLSGQAAAACGGVAGFIGVPSPNQVRLTFLTRNATNGNPTGLLEVTVVTGQPPSNIVNISSGTISLTAENGPAPVPEPATGLLLAAAVATLGGMRRLGDRG